LPLLTRHVFALIFSFVEFLRIETFLPPSLSLFHTQKCVLGTVARFKNLKLPNLAMSNLKKARFSKMKKAKKG